MNPFIVIFINDCIDCAGIRATIKFSAIFLNDIAILLALRSIALSGASYTASKSSSEGNSSSLVSILSTESDTNLDFSNALATSCLFTLYTTVSENVLLFSK